ncbi:hypothetical protein CC2G_012999 [Coprinopsis cinerea AmutBmut pab1-1]|nr:hypothetical protein CC2G_012999 [Coprinopsis cinerea AmutBmut pab1-1]
MAGYSPACLHDFAVLMFALDERTTKSKGETPHRYHLAFIWQVDWHRISAVIRHDGAGSDDGFQYPRICSRNIVIQTSQIVYQATDLVKINDDGVRLAAKLIRQKLRAESYTPRTWRTHPLHICPPEPYRAADPMTRKVLDWIFLISALNFSFWSEKEGTPERYGVEWRAGWESTQRKIHTGYWSLVAALDRALEEGIPITDPTFYGSETRCPDALISHIFREASGCTETIPLLSERISIMREVGSILTSSFGEATRDS